ncbi:MAG: hypothetical protein MUF58_02025 [Arcicella sp.]|jgi:amino acid transporter|nr:hypothetical protein [Arcicella sp.]
MNNFDDIQSLWDNQNPNVNSALSPAEIIAKSEKNKNELRRNHLATITVLTITVIGVIWYASVYGNRAYPDVTFALSLMIGSMFLRIGMEYISYLKFQKINLQNTTKECFEATTRFQQLRLRIQLVVTPLSLMGYVVGFCLLLPYIKPAVSRGFYLYILGSGIFFLIFISIIIYRQIKRERELMTYLKENYAKLMDV